MSRAPIPYPSRSPSPLSYFKNDKDLALLFVWLMILEAEDAVSRHHGRIASDSELLRAAKRRLLNDCGRLAAFEYLPNRETFFRKETGTVFREVVALRFRPGKVDQSAPLTAQIRMDAERFFLKVLSDTSRNQTGPSSKLGRDLHWAIETRGLPALRSDSADRLLDDIQPESSSVRRLIRTGRKLFP